MLSKPLTRKNSLRRTARKTRFWPLSEPIIIKLLRLALKFQQRAQTLSQFLTHSSPDQVPLALSEKIGWVRVTKKSGENSISASTKTSTAPFACLATRFLDRAGP